MDKCQKPGCDKECTKLIQLNGSSRIYLCDKHATEALTTAGKLGVDLSLKAIQRSSA